MEISKTAQYASNINSAQCALSICAAIAVLVGCNSAANVTPTQQSAELAKNAAPIIPEVDPESMHLGLSKLPGGGRFKGHYAGSVRTNSSKCGPDCVEVSLDWSGTGKARFLGLSNESGGVSYEYTEPSFACLGGKGSATLTSVSNPQNSVVMAITVEKIPRGCPNWRWTLQSGAGKFQGAAGSGGLSFKPNAEAYTDKWGGSLTY